MNVQKDEHGWPGVFIPGDEALGLAWTIREIINCNVTLEAETAFLRNLARDLELCQVKNPQQKVKRQ